MVQERLVFGLSFLFKYAAGEDKKTPPPSRSGRGYTSGLWRLLPLIVLAILVFVCIGAAAPLTGPSNSSNEIAQATVDAHLEDVVSHDTTMCGGDRTEPEPRPTKG